MVMYTIKDVFIILLFPIWSTNASWINVTSGDQVELGPFDALANKNGTTFIVSAHPCSTGNTFSLTIFRLKNDAMFIHRERIKKGDAVLRIHGTLGVLFDFHSHDHVEKYHYHITIKELVMNATTSEVVKYLPGNVIDVRWNMNRKMCLKHIGKLTNPEDNNGFLPQSACTHSYRHGDFSTICYKDNAFFMSVLNICTVPYAAKIVSMFNDQEISVHRFTNDKNDRTPVQIQHKEVPGKCGLIITFHSHLSNHEKQHTKVEYVCTNTSSNKNHTLIDDSYYTVYGMLCDRTNCSSDTYKSHTCHQKIFNSRGEEVSSVMKLTLDVCGKDRSIRADLNMTVKDFPKSFVTRLEGMTGMLDNSKRKRLDLGTKYSTTELQSHNGFMQIDGGEVSLYVTEEKRQGIFHVMLLRHFPYTGDRFPLLHDDFTIDKSVICTGKADGTGSKSSNAIRPWVVIVIVASCILLLIVVATFCYCCRKKKIAYKSGNLGLPYHIELDDDEFSIDSEHLAS